MAIILTAPYGALANRPGIARRRPAAMAAPEATAGARPGTDGYGPIAIVERGCAVAGRQLTSVRGRPGTHVPLQPVADVA